MTNPGNPAITTETRLTALSAREYARLPDHRPTTTLSATPMMREGTVTCSVSPALCLIIVPTAP